MRRRAKRGLLSVSLLVSVGTHSDTLKDMLRCSCTPLHPPLRSPPSFRPFSSLSPPLPLPTPFNSQTRPRVRPSPLAGGSASFWGPAGVEQRRRVSKQQTFRTRHGTVKVNLVRTPLLPTPCRSVLADSLARRTRKPSSEPPNLEENARSSFSSPYRGCFTLAQRPPEPHPFVLTPSTPGRYQEDAYSICSVALPRSALRWNVLDDRLGSGWKPDTLEGFEGEEPKEEGEERKRQVGYFGVFDGCVFRLFFPAFIPSHLKSSSNPPRYSHGGAQTSKYLSTSLAPLLEQARPAHIPEVVDQYRSLGGYLKRYRGGTLHRFRREEQEEEEQSQGYMRGMGLDEMAVLAFLQVRVFRLLSSRQTRGRILTKVTTLCRPTITSSPPLLTSLANPAP